MIFTTKAEYGVRFLIELGRQREEDGGIAPVSLKVIAEAEQLPLSYLERIVALLKKAGLVEATRGAHGGYLLACDPAQITMDVVIAALDGPLTPMTCFLEPDVVGAEGGKAHQIVCNHNDTDGQGCATKLLWMRVQVGVQRALSATTLADLVEFAQCGRMPIGERPLAIAPLVASPDFAA